MGKDRWTTAVIVDDQVPDFQKRLWNIQLNKNAGGSTRNPKESGGKMQRRFTDVEGLTAKGPRKWCSTSLTVREMRT